ncbi:DNA-3-methyladenine glycosylase I [Dermabacter sp. HSID17554]|uniref:DNA-3-methyladenine glycosylase I n=1 Tax=Dermabacter sp. HSID17554 TaxID=2419511 RepID=UPI000F863287|nr:DNA-3-methyladenine glycosylase I [Dermabacter sp. HSID17554]RUP87062.1 DNA-3-methyladenine glycosylase I [Dermabacter sp. HSID17554]
MNSTVKQLPSWASASPLMENYYLTEWGMPVTDEQGVFERLSLEVFQCGLSWKTILGKREAFREVFHQFTVDQVAAMGVSDIERLMEDRRIIRNRRKIEATIGNARAARALREEGTDLAGFLWGYVPEETYAPRALEEIPSHDQTSTRMSKDLKARGFSFVGPTTCFALMEAIGIVDTHLMTSPRRGTSGVFDADGRRAHTATF